MKYLNTGEGEEPFDVEKDSAERHKFIEVPVGSRYGLWTTISAPYFPPDKTERHVDVKCGCGQVSAKRITALRQGLTSDCARVTCPARIKAGLSGALPAGTRVGRLTVVSTLLRYRPPKAKGKPFTASRCRCACGNYVNVRTASLKRKVKPTQSCGCIRAEMKGRMW